MERKMICDNPKDEHDYYEHLISALLSARDLCWYISTQPDCTDYESGMLEKAERILQQILERVED